MPAADVLFSIFVSFAISVVRLFIFACGDVVTKVGEEVRGFI